MNELELVLAKRYARAFVAAFGVEQAWIQSLQELARVLADHRSILVMLTVPRISAEKKLSALENVFGNLPCAHALSSLVKLLIRDKRIMLFKVIIEYIVAEYYTSLGIVACTVVSSHALSGEYRKAIRPFLNRTFGKDTQQVYKVDRTLIAGIRIVSDTAYWEYSIRKQLQSMKIALVR